MGEEISLRRTIGSNPRGFSLIFLQWKAVIRDRIIHKDNRG